MITTAPAPADAGTPADTPLAGAPGLVAWYAEGFSDVLGDRLRLFDNAGPALELLRFSPAVANTPGFEAAVRARIDALAAFHHPAFGRVRALTVLDDPEPQLTMVSELAPGERLSTVLRAASARGARLDPTCAIWLLRHLLPAIAAFHEATGGAAHRLLDADRIVVSPTGEVAITEYVFGGLPEQLLPSRSTDVEQAALLAVAILRGEAVRPGEHDGDLHRLVQRACATSPDADVLRPWLTRALTAGPDQFTSAREAYHGLDELIPGVWGHWATSRQLPDGPGAAPIVRAPTARPIVSGRALPAGARASDTAAPRRVWRVNRTLAAVAALEALCIVGLLARGAMTTAPALLVATPPPIQAAGLALAAPPIAVIPGLATSPRAAIASPVSGPAASLSAPRAVIGWLVVESDVEVKVYVNGRLLGLATHRRFGVPAGEHTVTLASEDLRVRSSQPVRIVAGQSVEVTPTPPAQP